MRRLSIFAGATVLLALTTSGAWSQERLQRARQECWAQMGYPNGPVGNNAMRMSDQVSACVRAKMAGSPPQGAPGRGQAQR